MKVGVENGTMKVTLTKSKQWLDNLKFLVKCIEESMSIQDEDKPAFNGVVILTIALIVIKILSAIYRIPYQNILGDEGLYAYQQIYPIVALGMILSMNAIPSAVTQNLRKDQHEQYFSKVLLVIQSVGFVICIVILVVQT